MSLKKHIIHKHHIGKVSIKPILPTILPPTEAIVRKTKLIAH